MATLRGNRLIILIGLALIGTFILVATDSSFAQEKKKIAWSTKPENTKIPVQQALDIPDMAGHIIRINEYRRTWPDGSAPTVNGQKSWRRLPAASPTSSPETAGDRATARGASRAVI